MGIFSLFDAEWFFSCALVFGVRHGEGSVLFGKEFFSATQEGIDSVIVVDAVWCVCDAQMRMRTDFDRDAKLFRFQYYNIYLHSLLYTTQDRFGFIRVSVLLSSFSSAHWIWRRDCDVAMNDTACTHTHGCRRMQGCTVLGCWVLVLCCSWYANVVSVERDRRRVIEEWGESVVNERHILHLLYYYIEEYNGNRTVFGDAAKKCRTNSFMLARMMMHEQYIEAAVGSNEFAFRLNAKALTGAAKGDAIFFFHTIADFFLIQE